MMSPKRRKFQRPIGQRRYRRLFVIAVEGEKTEPQYFAIFNDQNSTLHVKCLKEQKKSSPRHVLNRMAEYLTSQELRPSDEAWLVVDKDKWTDEQLAQLHDWSQKRENYGFAVSNPKFEYWLLLHFEDGGGVSSSRDCSRRLNRHLPGYDKGIEAHKFTRDMIEDAISRARRRDIPACPDWPRITGGTTVYKLVESILRT